MARPPRTRAAAKQVEALRHEQDTRTNIPTAEYQSLVREEQEAPLRVAYQRRKLDLDPQLVWRGKDEQDLADLVVNVPPLYTQEKVHPHVLISDLRNVIKGEGSTAKAWRVVHPVASHGTHRGLARR